MENIGAPIPVTLCDSPLKAAKQEILSGIKRCNVIFGNAPYLAKTFS